MKKKMSFDTIKNKIYLMYPSIRINTVEYDESEGILECECLLDGCIFNRNVYRLLAGRGCPECKTYKKKHSYKRLQDSIYLNRKDLLQYFNCKDDAKLITPYSHELLNLVCPECGHPKQMQAYVLSGYKFTCERCGDGVSSPEKIMRECLNQLNVHYIPQMSFDWLKNKKYDFYIPLNHVIIETHGRQHYEIVSRGRSLELEQANDIAKIRLAKENGIENYIVIDCRESDFNYIKNNIINQLSSTFDLSAINWREVEEKSLKSYLLKSVELYKNGYDIKQISDGLNISEGTVYRYLNKGHDAGIINFIPYNLSRKTIIQLNKQNEIINEFQDAKSAFISTGISKGNITSCALGNRKSAGGFRWKYK